MTVEQIKKDRIQAMKDKDTVKKNLLSTLLGEIENSPSKGDESIVIPTIKSLIKRLKEVSKYEDNAVELAILENYLPKQLTEDQIRAIFADNGLEGVGPRMKFLKENYTGQYDGAVASKLAKE